MNQTATISYTPPETIRQFIKDFRPGSLFYDWIIGPVGSGKTTGIFFKLVYMAQQQAPGPTTPQGGGSGPAAAAAAAHVSDHGKG